MKGYSMRLFLLVVLALALSACTLASVKAPGGVSVLVMKFHPMGEELSIEGELDGLGSISVNRSTEDSQALIESAAVAAARGVLGAGLSPLSANVPPLLPPN